MPLSDANIRNASGRPGKTVKLSDGGGLQLWLTPNGSKLWYLAYQFAGKQRKLAIGPYPRIGLKDARQRCDDAKRQLDAGVDPSRSCGTPQWRTSSRRPFRDENLGLALDINSGDRRYGSRTVFIGMARGNGDRIEDVFCWRGRIKWPPIPN